MPLDNGNLLNGRYRIQRQLGKGGMGAVYLALDETLQIQVAVKENLNLNPESERQFKREATLLASLRHRNLPRVSDHFILEGRQYLIMDYIEGEDLSQRMVRKPATLSEVMAWGDSVCDALGYLHSQSPPIIHRDIKPANLKLQADNTLTLVDFGIAKIFDQTQTTTGARGLTPGFSPPEQYGGHRTDTRSDQYSLAATLYILLTGQRPADAIERMMKKETLKPVRELNPAVPEFVDLAIQRALSLEQDMRFPDIESFRLGIQGHLSSATILSGPPQQPDKPKRPTWLISAAAAGAVVIIGGALLLVRSGIFSGDDASDLPTATIPLIYSVAIGGTEPPATESAVLSPPPTEIPATATAAPQPTPTAAPVFIGGGGRIAFVSDREDGRTLQIWTMNPDGSDLRQHTFGAGDKTQPRWSPDGNHLLYVAAGGTDNYGNELGLDIFVMDIDVSAEPLNLTASIGDDTAPAWAPSGDRIAFTSTRVNDLRQVFLMDVSCGAPGEGCQAAGTPTNLSAGYAVEYSPAWSPNGLAIAVVASINQAGGRLFIRSPFGGEPSYFDVRDRIIGADNPIYSADGLFIAFTWQVKRDKMEIYIVSVEHPEFDPVPLTNSLGNKEPDFSPDGQYIAFTSTRSQNPEIYVMTSSGTGELNLTNHPARDMQPDWQPLPTP
ncbi:MAG: PD40 domain-containing protein [Anaerolineales bacterium]|nr:PD40 domain-containing protein [Anaerolineales bacterium]